MAKSNAGRPPKFDSPEQLQEKIQEYIDQNKESGLTITGLCYHCGFESRQSFYDLQKRDKFSYTIKRARLFIENFYELKLSDKFSTGAIFALKNLGWTDKQELSIKNDNLPFEIEITHREKRDPAE